MPKIIRDQFTNLKISRKKRYQLRMCKRGRCRRCGGKPDKGFKQCFWCRLKTRLYNFNKKHAS